MQLARDGLEAQPSSGAEKLIESLRYQYSASMEECLVALDAEKSRVRRNALRLERGEPDFSISAGKYWPGGLSLIWRLVLPPMKQRLAMSSASRPV